MLNDSILIIVESLFLLNISFLTASPCPSASFYPSGRSFTPPYFYLCRIVFNAFHPQALSIYPSLPLPNIFYSQVLPSLQCPEPLSLPAPSTRNIPQQNRSHETKTPLPSSTSPTPIPNPQSPCSLSTNPHHAQTHLIPVTHHIKQSSIV